MRREGLSLDHQRANRTYQARTASEKIPAEAPQIVFLCELIDTYSPESHRHGAGHESHDPGDQDLMLRRGRLGDAHNLAVIAIFRNLSLCESTGTVDPAILMIGCPVTTLKE